MQLKVRHLWSTKKSTLETLDNFQINPTYKTETKIVEKIKKLWDVSNIEATKPKYENKLIELLVGQKAVYRYVRQKLSSAISIPVVKKDDGLLCESHLFRIPSMGFYQTDQ